jgi:hypothetical protein
MWFSALARAFAAIMARWLPRLIAQVMVVFGTQMVVTHFAMPEIKMIIQGHFSGVPVEVYKLAALLKIDAGITVILSAIALKFSGKLALRAIPTPP